MRRTAASSVPVLTALAVLLLATACSDDGNPPSAPSPSGTTTASSGPSTPAGTATPGSAPPTAEATAAAALCAQIPSTDLRGVFGGQVGDGTPVAGDGATCRWDVTGTNVGGRAGTVTVSRKTISRAQFDAGRAAASAAAGASATPLGGVGDAAYFSSADRTLVYLKGDSQTMVRATFGSYDPANLAEAQVQTSLIAFGAVISQKA